MKVVQSALLNAPRFVADAVGTFNVMTGVVVLFATVELRSVPVVPRVSAATEVTVPEPLLLKVFQSVLVRYPFTDVVAAGMLIAGVAPPEDTTGDVPVTDVTVPDPLLLKFVQSVDVKYPFTLALAAGMLITGVAPPVEKTGAVAVTLVTVPTLMEPPRLTELPLMVMALFASWALVMVPLKSVVGTVVLAVMAEVPLPLT